MTKAKRRRHSYKKGANLINITLLSWGAVFSCPAFIFNLKHWTSGIQRLYSGMHCGAHKHSSLAEWCYEALLAYELYLETKVFKVANKVLEQSHQLNPGEDNIQWTMIWMVLTERSNLKLPCHLSLPPGWEKDSWVIHMHTIWLRFICLYVDVKVYQGKELQAFKCTRRHATQQTIPSTNLLLSHFTRWDIWKRNSWCSRPERLLAKQGVKALLKKSFLLQHNIWLHR